ncbi:hypothetical protein PVK06_029069 [Gossypium arboreum]|uniref:Uncharacterized protein n=1 Tax=Gossypium arboreum TaxID=29729 RepID=A0ABR0P5M9_GOSAR|nr:hypothetical protein PVK06_029069 [Gossypium arboreum]
MSYWKENVATIIPAWIHQQQFLWTTNALLINFSTVGWHNDVRVLRQIGCIQHVSDDLQMFDIVHGMNRKGKNSKNWAVEHRRYIALWNVQLERRSWIQCCIFNFMLSIKYQRWHVENKKQYIFGGIWVTQFLTHVLTRVLTRKLDSSTSSSSSNVWYNPTCLGALS